MEESEGTLLIFTHLFTFVIGVAFFAIITIVNIDNSWHIQDENVRFQITHINEVEDFKWSCSYKKGNQHFTLGSGPKTD